MDTKPEIQCTAEGEREAFEAWYLDFHSKPRAWCGTREEQFAAWQAGRTALSGTQPKVTPDSVLPRLEWCAITLRDVADRGRAGLGDSYPVILSVLGAVKAVLEVYAKAEPAQAPAPAPEPGPLRCTACATWVCTGSMCRCRAVDRRQAPAVGDAFEVGRLAGLEQAAKACEETRGVLLSHGCTTSEMCAAAVRALSLVPVQNKEN